MEAKDTVMSDKDIKGYTRSHLNEILSKPDAWAGKRLIAQFQAEISFKAGIAKGYSAGMIEGQYTNHKKHGKKMVKARQEGRMEVVEWSNEPCPHTHNPNYFKPRKLCEDCWQAKLKEWGIEC